MNDLPSTHQRKEILFGKVCPYCIQPTKRVDSKVIYGRSYGLIYFCEPCRAWVGVHKGTTRALGRLADAELRKWKQAAHSKFDSLWRMSTKKGRRWKAYAWLSEKMGIPKQRTHIGMFNTDQCKEVVRHCDELVASIKHK